MVENFRAPLTLATLGLVLLVPYVHAQGPDTKPFDTSQPPRGVVRDADGKPVAGAEVSFRMGQDGLELSYWRDTILRTRPLPRVRTSSDGEFFLPLMPEHRLFKPSTAGRATLVVEKAGFHPWVEPLSMGLAGYLGSTVTLTPIRKADLVSVEVTNPRPGMLLWVHRFSSINASGLDFDWLYEVPASGALDVPVQFVPTPLVFGAANNIVTPVGIEMRLLFPGRTTSPVYLEFGQKSVKLGETVPRDTRFVCALAGKGDAKLRQPRGLYRCPDGMNRWFPVDPDNVVESGALSLLALCAENCLAVHVPYIDPSEETITLAPVPKEVPERTLVLHDSDEKPVPGAQAYFFDLHRLPAPSAGKQLGQGRARRRLAVKDSVIDLPAAALPGPGFVYVEAPGHEPAIFFEPRAIRGQGKLDLGASGRVADLVLELTDEDGRPVVGATVAMQGRSYRLGAASHVVPRSDDRGRLVVPGVTLGTHAIRCVAPGYTGNLSSIRLAGNTPATNLTLHKTVRYSVRLVDQEGRPQAFRSVRVYGQVMDAALNRIRSQLKTNEVLTADSEGRILLTDYPRGITPRLQDYLVTLARVQQTVLEEQKAVQNVTMESSTLVVLPIGATQVLRESLAVAGRQSNRQLAARPGCRVVLARYPDNELEPVLTIYLRRGSPMRLSAPILAAARKRQAAGPLLIDQRNVVRRVALEFQGAGATDLAGARIEIPGMNFASGRPYLYGNSGLRVQRKEDGTLFVALRDEGAYEARVLHPEFLLEPAEIPAVGAETEKPVVVNLRRGTPVTFRLNTPRKPQPTDQLNLYVYSLTNQIVLYVREPVGDYLVPAGEGQWDLRCPVALEPGEYNFTLRIQGTNVNMPRRKFKVGADQALLIEVTGRAARDRVVQQQLQDNSKQLEETVKRLKGTAEALKQMAANDAKAKAQLELKLKTIEAQIAAFEKQLQALKRIEEGQRLQDKKKQQQPPVPLPPGIQKRR